MFSQTLFFSRGNEAAIIGERDVRHAPVAGEIDAQRPAPLRLAKVDVEGMDGLGVARAGVAGEGMLAAFLDGELFGQVDHTNSPLSP